jgi:hypothetical protein
MTHYLLSVYQPDGPIPAPDRMQQITQDIEALNREIRAAGAWVFAGGLQPADTARVLRPAGADGGADVLSTDGPYTEGKEHLGGFTIVDTPDLDAALRWGRKFATATGLPIEVRPFAQLG